MKSFWHALNSSGIWHQLIAVKYMKNMPLHTWFREKRFKVWNVSIIWRGFLSTLPWIGKGFLWNVGDGSAIRLGVDPVVGLGSSFILPRDLRVYLEDYGIVSLAQARNHTSSATGYWFTTDELDLGGEWKILWDNFIRGLEFSRIRLTDKRDSLLWSQNNYVGPLTAEKGYDCILSVSRSDLLEPDLAFLWKQKIPLKIVCFTWLMARGRILTWDQL